MIPKPKGGRKVAGRDYSRTAYEQILDLLKTRNLTQQQMVELCERDFEVIRRTIKRLHREKLVHITEWEVRNRSTGPHAAVWALGEGIDEKPPVPATRAERARRSRARQSIPSVAVKDHLLAVLMGMARKPPSSKPPLRRRKTASITGESPCR